MPDARPLTNGANGAIIPSRRNTRQRAPSAEGDQVKAELDWVSEGDLHLIRSCLTYYEAALNKAYREAEDPQVTLAVVDTVARLRRLDTRLRWTLRTLGTKIDNSIEQLGEDDDIPF